MKREMMTPDQELCVDARDCSIIVSAAAGSGKTAVLVERVVELLCNEKDKVPADSIVVVTFTEAAAKEMRQRIKNEMSVRLKNSPNNIYIQQQTLLLSSAHISTMHSFCMQLLKNEYQRFGLKSGFGIANDDGTVGMMQNEAVTDTLEKNYENSPDQIEELLGFFSSSNDERGLIDALYQLESFLESMPYPKQWIDKQIEFYSNENGEYFAECSKYISKKFQRQATAFLNSAESASGAFENLISDESEDIQETYREVYETFDNAIEERRNILLSDFTTTEFPDAVKVKNFRTNGCENGEKEKALKNLAKHALDDFDKALDEAISDVKYLVGDFVITSRIMKNFFKFYADYSKTFGEIKAENNVVTFNDLMRFTLKLLSDENGNRSEYSKRISESFSYIIVDEFQDTDDLQDAIFSMLSDDEKNLFIVGDTKQSIYRFRQANPEIFINRKDNAQIFSENDDKWKKIFLTKNFRSRKEVIDFVNFTFKQLMKKEVGGIDYDENEELVFGAEYYPEATGNETEICMIDKNAMKKNGIETENAEAVFLAQRIKSLINNKFQVTEKDGSMRPCRYSDICILLRKKKSADVYKKILEDCGIPALFGESKGFFIKTEVATIINLLRIIDNPLRDIETVSVMMSPMFLFTAEEIAKIRSEDKYSDFYVLLDKSKESKVINFVEILKDFRKYASCHSIESLVKRIYAVTSFLPMVRVLADGEQRVANLNTFLQKVKGYESKYPGGLSEFIRFIESVKTNSNDKTVLYSPGTDESVSILTMHKSKGLEYPICIVAEMSETFRETDYTTNQMILSKDNGIAFKIRNNERLEYYRTVPYKMISEKERKELRGEELRLLYVAMTRAREKLILSFNLNNSVRSKSGIVPEIIDISQATSMADWLMEALSSSQVGREIDDYCDGKSFSLDAAKRGIRVRVITSSGEYANLQEESIAEENQADKEKAIQIVAKVNSEYKYEQMCHLPSKVSVTELVHGANAGMMIFKEPYFVSSGKLSGAQIGTAHHKFMQYADFSSDVSTEIIRLKQLGKLSEEEATILNVNKLESALTTNVVERINKSKQIWREYEFMSEITAKQYNKAVKKEFEDTKISVQGVADCIFKENDGLVIVDYKTDKVKTVEELAEKYKYQLELYTAPIEKALNCKAKERIILSISLGEEIKV